MASASLSRALLVSLSVLLGLAVGEVLARALELRRPVSDMRSLHVFRPDRAWLYGMRPDAEARVESLGGITIRTNEDGFRDRSFAHPKRDDVARILVVGDSVSFGWGVEEHQAFPRLLEGKINALAGDVVVEVFNLGISGFNPFTEAELLKDVGGKYQPDLVLAQFSINDVMDPTLGFDSHTHFALETIPDSAYPDPSVRSVPSRGPSMALRACHHSRLCSAADSLYRSFVNRSLEWGWSVPDMDPPGPEWAWLEARFEEMRSVAAEGGAEFAVIAIPARGGVNREGVQDLLRAMGKRRGWVTIDPLPEFQRAYRPKQPLFLDLWHPDATGHRIVADVALFELSCRELIPVRVDSTCAIAAH